MGFTTNTFLFIFLPLSIISYLIANKYGPRAKNIMLLILNSMFYALGSIDTMLMFLLIVLLVWLFGQVIFYRRQNKLESSKGILVGGLTLMVGYLFTTKYLNFIINQFTELSNSNFDLQTMIVPIGISFVIFESVSYLIDIYRRDAKPGTFMDAALFLSLFPKIISGPIVLWKDFQPQIECKSNITEISNGIDRIIVGLSKKVILADTFGAHISFIESNTLDGADTPTLWLKATLYFFQIYFDFSGYSDIALGLCKVFGFNIKENFNFPYLSQSITEFWRRWHISLGTWFREYVYIPMGGNRTGNVYLNLAVVFVLTGIWHGANWTFLFWGIYNAIFVVAERLIKKSPIYDNTPSFIKWAITITAVFFGWILFAAKDLDNFILTINAMFGTEDLHCLNFHWQYFMSSKIAILLSLALLGSLWQPIMNKVQNLSIYGHKYAVISRKTMLILLLVISVMFVVNSSYNPFIYFQF